jgi:predicted secreted protein
MEVISMSGYRSVTCMHRCLLQSVLVLFAVLTAAGQPMAADAPVYDQYSLAATAESEVENDLMTVRLRVEHEDRDTAVLADKVNGDMQWALEQLKSAVALDYRTENYTANPKYEQNRIVGWRSSQTLTVSGSDFDQLKNIVQILQQRLQVADMIFSPSDDTRRNVEDALINEALDNFKRRAEIVQANMQASGYRIMHLNINTPGNQPGRSHMRVERMAMQSRAVEHSPAIEAGETRINVSVSGQIQLQ